MSGNNLLLTTAIEANANGLKSMRTYLFRLHEERAQLTAKTLTLESEIDARQRMQDAMEALQRLMPNDEAIKFVVPSDASR